MAAGEQLNEALGNALHDGSIGSESAARLCEIVGSDNFYYPFLCRVASIPRPGPLIPSLRQPEDFPQSTEVGVVGRQERKTDFRVQAVTESGLTIVNTRGGRQALRFSLTSLLVWRIDEFYSLGHRRPQAVHTLAHHVLALETALGTQHDPEEVAALNDYHHGSHSHPIL